MNNAYQFKVAWCPFCGQGWVEITKSFATKKLFFRCSECETEWDHVRDIYLTDKGTHGKYGMVEEPADEEIKEAGLEKYILK